MCEAKLSANSELKSHKAHFRKFLLLAMEASVAVEEADAVGVAFFLEAAVAPFTDPVEGQEVTFGRHIYA